MPPSGSTTGSALSPTPPQGGSDTGAPYAGLRYHSPLEGESQKPSRRRRLMRWGGGRRAAKLRRVPLKQFRLASWPFAVLRGPSWISLFSPSRTPFPTLGGSLSILLQPLSSPSSFFVALRGYLFLSLRAPSWIPFVDIFFGLRHGFASSLPTEPAGCGASG